MYGGAEDDGAYSISYTNDHCLFLVGATESFGNGDEDICALKVDTLGNVIWAKTYGGLEEDDSQYGQPTADGGYLISGYTSSFGAGDWDFYIIKTDEFGNAGGCDETSFTVIPNEQNMTAKLPLTQMHDANFVSYQSNTGTSFGGVLSECSATGINTDTYENEISIFPNPSSSIITIVLPIQAI